MILNDINCRDLELRERRRAAVRDGGLPDFAPQTQAAREREWRAAAMAGPAGKDLAFLPDVQSASEARSWARRLGDRERDGSAGVVLWVDSLWGAFDIEGILYELRDHVADVRCDEDGFLFRFIETFDAFPEFVLPDRDDMDEGTHFLRSFRRLVASSCSRRGIAFCGSRAAVTGSNDTRIEAADLLLVPRGRITERGMRRNIRTALAYLCRSRDAAATGEAALRARSAARLAAAQLWQWVRHETGVLDVGRIVTPALFRSLLEEQREDAGAGRELDGAAEILSATVLGESFTMHAFCEAAS